MRFIIQLLVSEAIFGGDGAADRARHRNRWLAIKPPQSVACDQDGLACAWVRVKNDLLGSDLDFRSLNAFLIEEIARCHDAGFGARVGTGTIKVFGRSKWAIAILFIRSSHDGA
jgi:hypothetical protein